MPSAVVVVLNWIIYALIVLVVVEVIVSNLLVVGRGVSAYSPGVRLLRRIVNPMLDPFRRLLPPGRTGGWDFSPVFVMLILSLVRTMLNRIH
jgi:YggT family protein